MAEFIAGRGTQALSIIGTVLGGLATVADGTGLMNGGKDVVTKSDLDNAIIIAGKDSEISLLKANAESERKMIDVYERVMTRINSDRDAQNSWNSQQALNNCAMSSAIATNKSSIDLLMGMTKTVIPINNVCPTPAVATTQTGGSTT